MSLITLLYPSISLYTTGKPLIFSRRKLLSPRRPARLLTMVPRPPLTSLFVSGRDWISLLLLGFLAEWTHRHLNAIVQWSLGWGVVKASFNHTDPSYEWLVLWLTKQTSWRRARTFCISTLSTGVEDGPALTHSLPTNLSDRTNLFLLPEDGSSYHAWFKGHLIRFWVSVPVSQDQRSHGQKLHLEIYTRRGQPLLVELLREAERAHRDLELGSITIHRVQLAPWCGVEWGISGTKRARPLESVVLDEGLSDKLLDDVKEFLESREWYRQRGIPFRRGYLMHGPPGTGKTSFIAALAAKLELDIYVLSLGGAPLDDGTLITLLAKVPSRAILLIEDVDASLKGLSSQSSVLEPNSATDNPRRPSSLTLGGLLNALDGIEASEGRLLFATTNHKDALDPALHRPGRMDVHVGFGMASRSQAAQLFKRFYPEHDFGIAAGERAAKDSDHDDKSRQAEVLALSSPSRGVAAFTTTQQARFLQVSEEPAHDIESMANRFASEIPERACTMATLQEYLMGYKRDPLGASQRMNIKDFLRGVEATEGDEEKCENRVDAAGSVGKL